MGWFLTRRLISLPPVLLVVGTVVFLLIHLTPGDPAGYMLGPDATVEDITRLREALNLDQPLLLQYGEWLWQAVRGNLGESLFLQQPVVEALVARAEPTLLLTVLSLVLAIAIGVPMGVVAAARRGTWVDQIAMVAATLGVSVPSFWLGLTLAMFMGVTLGWLPVAGYASITTDGLSALRYLLLPAVSLGAMEAALIARMTRSSVLETLNQDFVRAARAKGLSERVVLLRHAFRPAAIPVITVIGNTLAVLMGGAIVIETVFNIPGMGRLIIQSVMRRDYPLIQGAVLLIATLYVLMNVVVDLIYLRADPRIRYT